MRDLQRSGKYLKINLAQILMLNQRHAQKSVSFDCALEYRVLLYNGRLSSSRFFYQAKRYLK